MFWDAASFNGDISKWDVSRVTDMYGMFWDAASFTGDLSKWDMSKVRDMFSMFRGATSFSSDLSKWDVSSVQNMNSMFMDAASFNGNLSKWDVSNVKDMNRMFCDAALFRQKLCMPAWVHSNATKDAMFEGSSGSILSEVCTLNHESVTTLGTRRYIKRHTNPDRELIARMIISTAAISSTIASSRMCPKCGTFAKSGRASCCAPGGAWYNNCGGAGERKADHSWLEGMTTCKRKFEAACT